MKAAMREDDFDEEADAIACYYEAIAEIGKAVRAGAPVPEFLLPQRKPEEAP